LQSIRVTDGQDNEVLSVLIKDPGSKVIVSNENRRQIEFVLVTDIQNVVAANMCIQDFDRANPENAEFLLKLKRLDELTFHFRGQVMGGSTGQPEVKNTLTGLTFIHTTNQKDAKRQLTTDFNADPNV
jgi:hypothetical protein